MKKELLSLSIVVTFFLCHSCNESENNPVASVYVDFYIYLNDPSNIKLNSPGGWVYFTGGSKGIVVYRSDISTFKAFDRNCTWNSNYANALVSVDSSGLLLFDTSCGSKFLILDGSLSNGPATAPLRQYKADYNGVDIVHVYSY